MHPAHAFLGHFLGSLGFGSVVRTPPNKQEILLMRLDRAEKAYIKKINSPEYHAALAKRERKRRKLLNAV